MPSSDLFPTPDLDAAPTPPKRGVLLAGLAAWVAALAFAPAAAQELADGLSESPLPTTATAAPAPLASPLPIQPTVVPIQLDGDVSEAEWGHIAPLPMTMFSPDFRGEMTERTEIRITHDHEYLYVSGRMYDSEPDQIRTNTFYRDQYSGDDLIAVILDSYNDHETGVWFMTNPGGNRIDRTIANDAVGGGPGGGSMNSDWNAHWDVATRQTEEGWFAEFRIPFSSLRFQNIDGQVTMGLVVYRFIPRNNERQTFPVMDPGWAGMAFSRPSRGHRIVFQGVEATRPVYVTPYTLGGLLQTPTRRAGGGGGGAPAWGTDSKGTGEVGVDVRFSPTSNFTMDFTLNTDFAQVEADNQQINLTRFPLFFPEKRQFFQERASTFAFDVGGGRSRLFHSRRIGMVDGEIVRIYGGGRGVARIGGTEVGVLAMQTAPHEARGSETMGVVRLRQQVLNANSNIGGMLTTRLGTVGEDHLGAGLDASLRLVGDEWFSLKAARTFDEVVDPVSLADGAAVEARWQRLTDTGFSYWGEYVRVGAGYTPRLGFQARTAFQAGSGQLRYRQFRPAGSALNSLSLQVEGEHYARLSDGTPESRSFSPRLNFQFRGGTELRFSGNSSFESVRRPFAVAGAEVNPGEYWFHDGEVRLQLPRSSNFRGNFSLLAGSFYDGSRVGLGLNPTWNQSRHLELDGGYEMNRLGFSSRGVNTMAHLLKLNVQTALNTRVSASVLGQYSNIAELVTFNARFRYHFGEGTDLWVVFNEGVNVGDRFDSLSPHTTLPRSSGRTVMVKYTRALIW